MVQLGEVAEIERQGVDPSTLPVGTPYLGLEHIERGGRLIGRSTVGDADLRSTKFLFTKDHFLYGKLRPNLGKISRPGFNGVCSADILPIRARAGADKDFLAHYLSQPSMVEFAASRTTGANLPRLSPAVLASFPVPLPSLDQQRRIAALLDRADALRVKRRRMLEHLDALTQSIFHDMFDGDLEHVSLGDIAEFRYGTSNKSGSSGYPALRIPNVVSGAIDFDEIKLVEVENEELERLRLVAGDLLFVRTNGNPQNVGRCAMFSVDAVPDALRSTPWIYASYLIRARLADDVLPQFAVAYLASSAGRRSLRERSRTSAGQFNINTASLGTVPIPVASIEQQQEFASRIDRVEAQRAIVRRAITTDDALFASLQSRAFKGEL